MKYFKTFEQAENTAALATMCELVAKFTHKTITILAETENADYYTYFFSTEQERAERLAETAFIDFYFPELGCKICLQFDSVSGSK